MAKNKNEMKFTNSEIDWNEKKIIETVKDGVQVYDLEKIMEEWHGKQGLNITIFQNLDIEPDSNEY